MRPLRVARVPGRHREMAPDVGERRVVRSGRLAEVSDDCDRQQSEHRSRSGIGRGLHYRPAAILRPPRIVARSVPLHFEEMAMIPIHSRSLGVVALLSALAIAPSAYGYG